MGQVDPIPKEDCIRGDSRRLNSEISSSGFPKPDRCKGVGTLVILHRTVTYLFFFKRLTNGASVRLTGVLTPSPGPGQESELLAEAVEVLGPCDPEVHQTLTLVF